VQRVLPSDEIASSVAQAVPRLRLPDRAIFSRRAERLGQLAADHALSDYLRLMQTVALAQHALLAEIPTPAVGADAIARSAEYRMPILPATGHREHEWHTALVRLCDQLARQPGVPAGVVALLDTLRHAPAAQLDTQADALLTARIEQVDIALAPFIMAALQVCWTGMAGALDVASVPQLDIPGVCPVCGSLPVASVVRAGKPYDGFRYLHCALCATEWHKVRAKCSHCDATEGIAYRFIEGGDAYVRAETCEQCHTYCKILYQENDQHVEAVADDLASIALDLLVGEAGYRRANPNPFLWQGGGD
jgi:FdhE protein